MMIKKRIVPEHEEEYMVCDYCEEEITDYSYMTCGSDRKPNKHFHTMRVGGSKGSVEKTCLELSGRGTF